MVHLTKIYTKTGDKGLTSLANGNSAKKTDQVINAIGAIDEANSAIGMCIEYHNDIIYEIQNDLFDLGAELTGSNTVSITEDRITRLEGIIDDMNQYLQPLNSFVLPTGSLHNARSIVRRAEREVWAIDSYINPNIPKYLNRLSDLLFVMARYFNKGNEKLWEPKS